MTTGIERIVALGAGAASRTEVVVRVAEAIEAREVLEIGVWKGEFASALLRACGGIRRYWMLDPWRQLAQWDKPFNVSPEAFEAVFAEAMAATEFAAAKRRVLRGTTTERIHDIADGSLDLIYIDGDHTLRGIAIDLICAWAKLRPGGVVIGDDFAPRVWQHGRDFEPTMVFPFAVNFAEAQGTAIAALPHNQFAILRPAGRGGGFAFLDPAGRYRSCALKTLFGAAPGGAGGG
ncbi:MAG: class I SAM-dependent methyltransferase [Alkalilacustris sp.]